MSHLARLVRVRDGAERAFESQEVKSPSHLGEGLHGRAHLDAIIIPSLLHLKCRDTADDAEHDVDRLKRDLRHKIKLVTTTYNLEVHRT